MRNWRISAIFIALPLSACAISNNPFSRHFKDYSENRASIDKNDVASYVASNDAIMKSLATLASADLSATSIEWLPVVQAGLGYVDMRCQKYMDAIFFFDRMRDTTSKQIQFTGAAAGAALGVVEASKDLIALTPLGFSLADQTINNVGKGLLFELPPSVVQTIVKKKQDAYRGSLSKSYTSRAVALQVIQNYATICLPPAIEAEVSGAITRQEFKPNTIPEAKPETPATATTPPASAPGNGGAPGPLVPAPPPPPPPPPATSPQDIGTNGLPNPQPL